MHSTSKRRDHILGLMVGVAIGDALGFAREGLERRAALKLFGRKPLKYALLPGKAIYSDDTQLMLMAAQATVQCRGDHRRLVRNYQTRLSAYLFSLPIGIGRATISAAFRSIFRFTGLKTGVNSAGNGPCTRALFCSLAINGTGYSMRRWMSEICKVTHTDPVAIEACLVLGQVSEYGATHQGEKFSSAEALKVAIAACDDPKLLEPLSKLDSFLKQRRSPSAVARSFGWGRGVSGYIVPSVVMAIYCWLRYPEDFRKAVESSICLGGDADSVGAIVGGLSGGHLGIAKIPEDLQKGLVFEPHGKEWMEKMAERMSHWPHGAEDLNAAPGLPIQPVLQLFRNLYTILFVLLHLIYRLLGWLITSKKPRRER